MKKEQFIPFCLYFSLELVFFSAEDNLYLEKYPENKSILISNFYELHFSYLHSDSIY